MDIKNYMSSMLKLLYMGIILIVAGFGMMIQLPFILLKEVYLKISSTGMMEFRRKTETAIMNQTGD